MTMILALSITVGVVIGVTLGVVASVRRRRHPAPRPTPAIYRRTLRTVPPPADPPPPVSRRVH